MGLRDHAKKLMYRRPKGRYLLDLPIAVLCQISHELNLGDKKNARLVCKRLQLAGGIDLFTRIKIDLANCNGSSGCFEREEDYREIVGVSYDRPETWMVIKQRKDIHDFCEGLVYKRTSGEYLKHTSIICLRLSAVTFGLGHKVPESSVDIVHNSNYTEQGLWLIERVFPQFCTNLDRIEILVSTFNGTIQHIGPIMRFINFFADVPKSISSCAYIKLMNKDPLLQNVDRYQVTTRAFGTNLSVPSTVRCLEFNITASPSSIPIRANSFSRWLYQLPNLKELSLSGISVNCSYEDQWIPESVQTLELVYDRPLNRSYVTFPGIRTLKLHMVSENLNSPFDMMDFPDLEYLYIREKVPAYLQSFTHVPSTLSKVRTLQVDVKDAPYSYLPRLLSHFSSRAIENLILSGTFDCQEFIRAQSGSEIRDQMRRALKRLKGLRTLVLNSGVEVVANLAIVRAFLELGLIQNLYVYPADYWDESGLTCLSPVRIHTNCRNTESEYLTTVKGYEIDIGAARRLSDSDWHPRVVNATERLSDGSAA